MSQMIQGYLAEIEGLRAKLLESESVCGQLRKAVSRSRTSITCGGLRPASPTGGSSISESRVDSILELAKKDLQKNVDQLNNRTKLKESASDQSDSNEGKSYFLDGRRFFCQCSRYTKVILTRRPPAGYPEFSCVDY